jgi:hypothetical protein
MHACIQDTQDTGPNTDSSEFAPGLGGRDRINLLFCCKSFHVLHTLILLTYSDSYNHSLPMYMHCMHAYMVLKTPNRILGF